MKLVHLGKLEEVGVSHNPDIKKKVILDRDYIPKLMTFGQATFQPGQAVDAHKHDTMFEVFFIQSGKARFVIDEKVIELVQNDCITIEQGEMHAQSNPYEEPVTWLYFGIATD